MLALYRRARSSLFSSFSSSSRSAPSPGPLLTLSLPCLTTVPHRCGNGFLFFRKAIPKDLHHGDDPRNDDSVDEEDNKEDEDENDDEEVTTKRK